MGPERFPCLWYLTAAISHLALPHVLAIESALCHDGNCQAAKNDICSMRDTCGVRSDGLQTCTPCNRTYFGILGHSYRHEITPPPRQCLPWTCTLNLTTIGGGHGDIIQLSWDRFTVGILERTPDRNQRCKGGMVTLMEHPSEPKGAWCGDAWGHMVYYSDTQSVLLTVSIDSLQVLERFQLSIIFKSLSKPSPLFFRDIHSDSTTVTSRPKIRKALALGEPVPGTLCSRHLESCDQQRCRIQSPNYPGFYPRNATCFYYIRQSWTPEGYVPVITVSQPDSTRFHIKANNAGLDAPDDEEEERKLLTNNQCNDHGDHLTLYDGGTVDSPKLVRVCGGGALPEITSSGSQMLIVFKSSEYNTPSHPWPLRYLAGFALEVTVQFVNKAEIARGALVNTSHCSVTILSSKTTQGIVQQPVNTLPESSVCSYHFQGRANEQVWIYFITYYHERENNTWSGPWAGPCLVITDPLEAHAATRRGPKSNATHCQTSTPRLCSHWQLDNQGQIPKPCSLRTESYVSSGSQLSLQQFLPETTATSPWTFKLHYEFVSVDTPQDLTEAEHVPSAPCHQLFESHRKHGAFYSPKNLFLYGRGGAKHLECVYTFKGSYDQGINITLDEVFFQLNSSSATQATLTLYEYPWLDVRRRKHQLSRTSVKPLSIVSQTNLVELVFRVESMNYSHDFQHFRFKGRYEFFRTVSCAERRRTTATRGTIDFSQDDKDCLGFPWLLQAPPTGYLYLEITGHDILPENGQEIQCLSGNRITVYSVPQAVPLHIICPDWGTSADAALRVFSPGWDWVENALANESRHLMIEATAADSSPLMNGRVRWLVVYKDLWVDSRRYTYPFLENNNSSSLNATQDIFVPAMLCDMGCPELEACIPPSLWCDGVLDCPSGVDERDCYQLDHEILYIGGYAIVAIILASCVTLGIGQTIKMVRQRGIAPQWFKNKCKAPLRRSDKEDLYSRNLDNIL